MSTENKEILRRANSAIITGDYEGFLAYCTDDTEWHFVGDKILRGKKEVLEWMKTNYKVPPNFTVDKLIAEDDFVTAIGKITMQDEQGKDEHYSYCDVWRFHNQKMIQLMAFVIKDAQSNKR